MLSVTVPIEWRGSQEGKFAELLQLQRTYDRCFPPTYFFGFQSQVSSKCLKLIIITTQFADTFLYVPSVMAEQTFPVQAVKIART